MTSRHPQPKVEGAVRDASSATTGALPERRFVSRDDLTCRMFKREWIERLSHVAPWVPHAIYLPAIAVALWLGSRRLELTESMIWFAGGVLLWTLVEYVIHRFVFHPPEWIEEDTRRICAGLSVEDPVMPALPTFRHRFYFLVHGVHHDYPNDSTRLVMPPGVSIPLAFVFLGLFMATAGAAAPTLFAGFGAGYLAYDTIHYLTHLGAHRTAVGRALKKRHYRHHYADSSRNFGVSTPLWDYLLGTVGRSDR